MRSDWGGLLSQLRLFKACFKAANCTLLIFGVPLTQPTHHAGMLSQLRLFKARFKAASCTLVAAADSQVFLFGAEQCAYEGPLKIK